MKSHHPHHLSSSPGFIYSQFPTNPPTIFPRKIPPLDRHHDLRRLMNTSSHFAIQKKIIEKQNQDNTSNTATVNTATTVETEKILEDSKRRYLHFAAAMSTIKSLYRMKKCQHFYQKQLISCRLIQHFYQQYRTRKILRIFSVKQLIRILLIQKYIRRYLCQRRYQHQRRALVMIQQRYRGHYHKLRYQQIKHLLKKLFLKYRTKKFRGNFLRMRANMIRLQAWYRQYRIQRFYFHLYEEIMKRYRQLFFLLWKRYFISYGYRARYWRMILTYTGSGSEGGGGGGRALGRRQVISYLTLAIQRSELKSFQEKYHHHLSPPHEEEEATGTISATAGGAGAVNDLRRLLRFLDLLLQKEAAAAAAPSGGRHAPSGGGGGGAAAAVSHRILESEKELVQEKLFLYSQLKAAPKNPNLSMLLEQKKEEYFEYFKIIHGKRRKHKLVEEMLWREFQDCEISCEVTLSLLSLPEDGSSSGDSGDGSGNGTETLMRWRREILNERITVDMIEIVREWMKKK
jgi:hypothetical protein